MKTLYSLLSTLALTIAMFVVYESYGQAACVPHLCPPCESYVKICNTTNCELSFVWGYEGDPCDGVVGYENNPVLYTIDDYPTDPCSIYSPNTGWSQPLCRKFCEDGPCSCPISFQLMNPVAPGTVDPWGPITSWVCPNPPQLCTLTYEILPPDNGCCGPGLSLMVDVKPGTVLYQAELIFYCGTP